MISPQPIFVINSSIQSFKTSVQGIAEVSVRKNIHDHLNEQNADIYFTKEIEENGKIPFLDCLVSRDRNELQMTVYRKPTHR